MDSPDGQDLPAPFGNGSTAHARFRDWVAAGVFDRSFEAVSDEPDAAIINLTATVMLHAEAQQALPGVLR